MTEWRVETGRMQLEGDRWPGVFLRGKDALAYAGVIRRLIGLVGKDLGPDAARDWHRLSELAELLESCRVGAVKKPR
jgi:hypothetical protein